MEAIVLAAGKGSRMAPLCTKVPKPLLPLAGRPILLHLLDRLQEAGVTHATVVTNHLAPVVESIQHQLPMTFVRQESPQGTGHAVATADVDEDALVVMGDSLVSTDTLRSLASTDGLVVAAAQVQDPGKYGILAVEGDRIQGLQEKPDEPAGDLANTGFYRVRAEDLAASRKLRPSARGELEFTDVVHQAAQHGEAHFVRAEGWRDVGTPWDYLSAHESMLTESMQGMAQGIHGAAEPNVHVHGRLIIEEGGRVRSGSYVEGDVLVRAGADVGPNAHLRGPLEIGPRCRVGTSEIKNSLLLEGARAPHFNYVGDSILGHHCNLGAGTKTANVKVTPKAVRVNWDGTLVDTGRRKFGAVVGDGARIGINCSMDPGTVVGSQAVVGAGNHLTGWIGPSSRLL